ncbi:MAG: alanine racemase [Steroidobacteraceae bacterium]|nr:alanine racemase [Steroidobacteraceae bacterium]
MRSRPTAILDVDLDALAANYALLVRIAAPANVAGVVKADAYGLGAAQVARRLAWEGCGSFFVANAAEGVALRPHVPEATIYSLGGLPPGASADCVNHDLVPVLNSVEDVRSWLAEAPGRPAAIQLDTGMTRAGLDAGDLDRLAVEGVPLERLSLVLVLTHFACADEPAHPLNARQVEVFDRLRRRLPAAATSIANSAGTLLGPGYRGDLVRTGIALYGGRPAAAGPNPMREVVRLRARVLQLRDVDDDVTVGYGATHRVRAPARIAIVGAGYADGYPRSLGGRGHASVAGRHVPVIGRVSMDVVTLDVTSVPRDELRVGDWVSLLGGGVPIDALAEAAGTIAYELLTRIGPRVERRYAGAVDGAAFPRTSTD